MVCMSPTLDDVFMPVMLYPLSFFAAVCVVVGRLVAVRILKHRAHPELQLIKSTSKYIY